MSHTNSETVSKKRGRPKLFADDELSIAKFALDDSSATLRSVQNRCYAIRAIGTLMQGGESYSLLPTAEEVDAGKKKLPFTLLSLLGRLGDDEMRSVLRRCCDQGMSRKEAVNAIKSYRRTKKIPFDALDLAVRIERTVNDYGFSHDCSVDQLREVLYALLAAVSEKIESEQG